MKVLCLPEAGKLEVREFLKPNVRPGYAVVKILRCGICGSDVTAYRGVNPTMKYPVNGLGHEGVGIIEEVGENDRGLKTGDRVTLEPYIPCNKCYMCRQGRFNNCTDIRVCGVHKEGMMSEYFLQPVNQIYKIPDEMSFEHAVLVEPLTIGLHANTRAHVSKGEKVVIFGAGVIGLMAAFGSIHYGAEPILIDVVQERLDYAKSHGIPYIFNSREGGVPEFLSEVTNSKMPDAMIDCTGAPAILEQMHDYVCYGGRIALVGWPHNPIAINTVRLMQKEIDVCPSRNSNQKFPEAIQMVKEEEIPSDAMITKIVEMDEVESAIQDITEHPADYLKVIVNI
ncbi:zinc-dependent alcohol dehydrogenase [Muricomes intestini]|uniref:zinc-dependent alcohol dehydrogenase n=1 Tax=Muricomes intestini TaxID=1796634 RepID=UPI002FDD80A9